MARRCSRRLWLQALEDRTAPAVFTVSNTNDAGAGSLRQAILDSNAATGADSIVFDATAFTTAKSITLTSGQLNITDALTITGPAIGVTISGNNANRVVGVNAASKSGTAVALNNLTITAGKTGPGSGINNFDEALTLNNVTVSNCQTGGINVQSMPGSLTMTNCSVVSCQSGGINLNTGNISLSTTDCAVTNNSNKGDGGGIYCRTMNTATLIRTTISGNSANNGGGIAGYGILSMIDCTISNNSANLSGGGISMPDGKLTVTGSTISGNRSNLTSGFGFGGAGIELENEAEAIIRNSTISGNRTDSAGKVGWGGGIAATQTYPIYYPKLTIQNTTIAFNSAKGGLGGGIYVTAGTINSIESSIIANNSADTGPDVSGNVNMNFSLVRDPAGMTVIGANNKLNQDPLLDALYNSGGKTATHQLLPGSPALNAGSNPAGLTTDQRGAPRTQASQSDIGAVEEPITGGRAIATDVTSRGGTTYVVSVDYFDDIAIDTSTVDTHDLTIAGPAGTLLPVSVSVSGSGALVHATYVFLAPGGYWESADNGTYTISLNANQIFDLNSPTPNSAAAGVLRAFSVNIGTVYVVNALNDEAVDTDGLLSLREAINLANASAASIDTITFAASLVAAGDNTVGLSLFDTGIDIGEVGPSAFEITTPFCISGPAGANGITIARTSAAKFRLFHVTATGDLTLENLTLAGGLAQGFTGGGPGGGGSAGMGGAVFNQGNLQIRGCTLVNNQAIGGQGGSGAVDRFFGGGGGAGLGADGANSNSVSGGAGGGPSGGTGGPGAPPEPFVTSTKGGFGGGGGGGGASSNVGLYGSPGRNGGFGGGGGAGGGSAGGGSGGSGGFGGGGGAGGASNTPGQTGQNGGIMFFGGYAANDGTTGYGGGGAGMGGAIFSLNGTVSIVNSTLTNNAAVGATPVGIADGGQGVGGAIFVYSSPLSITHSTLADNSAASMGGGIYVFDNTITPPIVTLNNTILTTSGAQTSFVSYGVVNCFGDGNLIVNNVNYTGGIVSSAPPLLSPLADNGGPTQTLALMPGSPAIDAANIATALTVDQRGFSRTVGSGPDIGAYEFGAAVVNPAKISGSIVINGGTAQRSRVTEMKVTFDRIVTLAASPETAFVLTRNSDGALVSLKTTVDNSGPTTVVTINFIGGAIEPGDNSSGNRSLSDGRYTLRVLANQVDAGYFDGNTDGTPGDDYVLVGDPITNKLFRLFGDADGNGLVDGLDFGAFRTSFNFNSFTFDFDGSGVVDGLDFGQFRARFGVMI